MVDDVPTGLRNRSRGLTATATVTDDAGVTAFRAGRFAAALTGRLTGATFLAAALRHVECNP